MHFFEKFPQTSWIECLKRLIEERFGCPGVFYEKIIAGFQMKNSQNGTENDKKPKMFQF